MKPKFKFGDKVVCDNEVGIVYSMLQDFGDKFSYLINLGAGHSFWVDEYKLKLIKQRKKKTELSSKQMALLSL